MVRLLPLAAGDCGAVSCKSVSAATLVAPPVFPISTNATRLGFEKTENNTELHGTILRIDIGLGFLPA